MIHWTLIVYIGVLLMLIILFFSKFQVGHNLNWGFNWTKPVILLIIILFALIWGGIFIW